jgi:OOP family OmpA-OmpF porin
MKKLNKVAALLATLALASPMLAQAQTPTAAEFQAASGADNWRDASGQPWRNGPGSECWRDSSWTPATAYPTCDGAAKPPPPAPMAAAAPPPPPAAPPPAPAPAPVAAAPRPAAQKVTYAADTFFDFDKYVIKPEGKAKLDDLVDKTKGIALEVIIAVGHTDNIGTVEYNQKLSERRANAVKDYLVSKGMKNPIASNSTAEGRAKNRRTEIEVVGTRAAP